MLEHYESSILAPIDFVDQLSSGQNKRQWYGSVMVETICFSPRIKVVHQIIQTRPVYKCRESVLLRLDVFQLSVLLSYVNFYRKLVRTRKEIALCGN